MEKKKFSKKDILNKILKIAPKVLYDILIIFCIALILVVVWQIITDNNESIGGYRLFRIVSGSMVPEYNVDEVVVCKDTNVEKIKVGDIIVYRGKTGELTNRLIMHEVIDINQGEEQLVFHVKGIQNTTGDPDVLASQILGVVVHKSNILTWLYHLATSTYSSFVIIVILVINVFISFLPKKEEIITLDAPKEKKADNVKKEKKKKVNKNLKRYTLKDFDKYIKIIRKDYEVEIGNQVETTGDVGEELDEKEKLKEENKRLEEEIKKLKEEINKNK